MNTQKQILRQNKVDELVEIYYKGFDDFQNEHPYMLPGLLQPIYDEIFNEKHLKLTRKTRQPIWKRL